LECVLSSSWRSEAMTETQGTSCWSQFEQSVPSSDCIEGGADLHIHTSASDGTNSPREVVRLAAAARLDVVAITDHDTVDGIPDAVHAGSDYDVTVIPGVEVSTSFGDEEVHVLGYYVDPNDRDLRARLQVLNESRLRRAEKIVRRLNQLGLAITIEEVVAQAGDGSVGRPHVARALVTRGYVPSIAAAFDHFLTSGRPAYVPRMKVAPEEAIDLLHGAGAAVSLAHPGLITQAQLVTELLRFDFDAVEIRHSEHSRECEYCLWCRAREADLALTGGSDWHGKGFASREKLGRIRVPLSWVTRLRRTRDRYRRKDSPRGS